MSQYNPPNFALPSAATGTTQSPYNDSTALATTAYVDLNTVGFGMAGFHDDFMSTEANNAVTSAFNWISDSGNWVALDIVASCGINNTTNSGTFANPGLLTFTTGTSSGNGAAMYKSGVPQGALGSNAGWEMNFFVNLPATTLIAIRLGAFISGQQATDPPTGGIYCEYDTANTGNTATGYTLVCRNASTSTYAGNTVVPNTAGFDHIRIFSTVAGTIQMSINGANTVSASTNVTTAAVGINMEVLTRTTAAKVMIIDAVSYMAASGRV